VLSPVQGHSLLTQQHDNREFAGYHPPTNLWTSWVPCGSHMISKCLFSYSLHTLQDHPLLKMFKPNFTDKEAALLLAQRHRTVVV
jgi:hypothetical protein